MLFQSDDIFRNARYLYSTQDKSGNTNIYRWNYFYTPVQIGNEIVGVRIAVRDMVRGTHDAPESQIYNWKLKSAPLDGGSHSPKVNSSDVSSDALTEGESLNTNISHPAESRQEENTGSDETSQRTHNGGIGIIHRDGSWSPIGEYNAYERGANTYEGENALRDGGERLDGENTGVETQEPLLIPIDCR